MLKFDVSLTSFSGIPFSQRELLLKFITSSLNICLRCFLCLSSLFNFQGPCPALFAGCCPRQLFKFNTLFWVCQAFFGIFQQNFSLPKFPLPLAKKKRYLLYHTSFRLSSLFEKFLQNFLAPLCVPFQKTCRFSTALLSYHLFSTLSTPFRKISKKIFARAVWDKVGMREKARDCAGICPPFAESEKESGKTSCISPANLVEY